MSRKFTTEQFVSISKLKHGDLYDYSRCEYIDRDSEVVLICPKHGEFLQRAGLHYKGHPCPACGKSYRAAQKNSNHASKFIPKCILKHGNKYDYSSTTYLNSKTMITVECKKHGPFSVMPSTHLRMGVGCSKCAGNRLLTYAEILERFHKQHGNKYEYPESFKHTSIEHKIIIRCPDHGYFEQIIASHLDGHGCVSCKSSFWQSKPELEIVDYIRSLGVDLVEQDRKSVGKELDIFIPSASLAIEFNGLFYHSFRPDCKTVIKKNETPDQAKKRISSKHKAKFLACEKAGIELWQIDEEDWSVFNKREIWKSRIGAKVGRSARKIGARKCSLVKLDLDTAKEFFEENHLQGSMSGASWSYGLSCNQEIVAAMSFSWHLHGESLNLARMAFKRGVSVAGGSARLFRYSLSNLPSFPIVTFSDNIYTSGSVYKSLGFEFDRDFSPRRWWVMDLVKVEERSSRRGIMKPLTSGDTQEEKMYASGYRSYWDAGYRRWIYRAPK